MIFMLFILPLFYFLYICFWVCVIGTVVVLYAAAALMIFILTALAMGIRAIFRSQWPANPRRPSLPRHRRVPPRPTSQAKFSDRR